MGQAHSTSRPKEVPIEEISHDLALRFAEKCFTHLEVAHFRDNFKTLSDHQDDIEYWKEETLCRFLSIPNSLHAGPVIYQMATYLGSFPFPSLAPCILTREAMIKVITILTGRYRRILKQGDQDKNKLLFRSLAVFDRGSNTNSPVAEKSKELNPINNNDNSDPDRIPSTSTGFAIDEPLNDDEEEGDDNFALAALEALDAIEVFQQDQRTESRIQRAHIPADYLHKLFMLILLFAPVTPQDNLASFSDSLDVGKLDLLAESASSLIAAFDPDQISNGIQYKKFVRSIPVSLVHLFRPLSPLFEHFLFSKNIDLSTQKAVIASASNTDANATHSLIYPQGADTQSKLLSDVLLAQMSLSLEIATPMSMAASSFFHCGARFSEIFSISSHGTSMSSFSRQVLSWRSATLLLVSGTSEDNISYLFGAYLPNYWSETGTMDDLGDTPKKAALIQLKPRHAVFFANKYNKSMPPSHFSTKTGIGLGCILPAQSRIQSLHSPLILGPVSLLIDEDIASATFQHDPDAGIGAFCTDPSLEEAQRHNPSQTQSKKVKLDIDALEVWGIGFVGSGNDEIANQKKRLEWEEAEAARRRGVNFGGDKDGARALLEMAGIVGDGAANRSGGSV